MWNLQKQRVAGQTAAKQTSKYVRYIPVTTVTVTPPLCDYYQEKRFETRLAKLFSNLLQATIELIRFVGWRLSEAVLLRHYRETFLSLPKKM